MKNNLLPGLLACLFFWGCENTSDRTVVDLTASDPTICKSSRTLLASLDGEKGNIKKFSYPGLVYSDNPSDFPKIQANRNLETAGILKNQVLTVELEVSWGDFYLEDE